MDDRMKMAAAALLAIGIGSPAMAEVYTNSDGQRVECHDEQVTPRNGHPIAAPLAGAVIGGVVGNQIGKGTGKDIATGAGAVGGAMVGKSYDDNRTAAGATVQHVCKPIG